MRRIVVIMSTVMVAMVVCAQQTNHPPQITSIAPSTAETGRLYQYNVSAFDPDDDELTFSLEMFPTGMEINESTGVIKWVPSVEQTGLTTVKVVVSDGNASASQTFTITVTMRENEPPQITSIPIEVAYANEEYRYDVNATDADDDDLTYGLKEKPEGMKIDEKTGLITWFPSEEMINSTQYVEVYVSDNMTKSYQSFIIHVKKSEEKINHPPKIISYPSFSATVGEEYISKIEAMDPDNDILIYELSVGPPGMTIDNRTGNIRWLPNKNDIGSHQIKIVVSDGNFSESAQFTINVKDVSLNRKANIRTTTGDGEICVFPIVLAVLIHLGIFAYYRFK